MRRLIEEGADLNALTNDGKSPVKLAEEMKCSLVLERALEDSGRYNADLTPRLKPRFHSDLAKKITFCVPFVCPLLWRRELTVLVYYLDYVGVVFCFTVLFVELDGCGMAFCHECCDAEGCGKRYSWCGWTNS
jgi:hypothetical protein